MKKTTWLVCLLALAAEASELKRAPDYMTPDERYKVDLLLVTAHPDDETGDIAGYLTRVISERQIALIG